MTTLAITPKTKVGDLLDAYPQLEDLLISLAPAFSKLRNPILRRTIARVATLQQAALTGDIGVGELVRTLRLELGHDHHDTGESDPVRGNMEQADAAGKTQDSGAAAGQRVDDAERGATDEHPRIAVGDPPPPGHEPPATREERPDWARDEAVSVRIDAISLLDQGANPLNAVIRSIGSMPAGDLLHMIAPFYPAPMVDVLRSQGHDVWGEEIAGGWAMWVRKN